ncbi:MAG: NAAT family transporter [Fidelibacterota bacterium]|nr:MAG: NAAT family transporter [Candidatus Neomarinimicrobiota bacterium]
MDIPFFVFAFSSLFTLVNPVGISPAFVSLTQRFPPGDVPKIALRGTLAAAFILFVFALIGDLIFSFYHITIHAFRIAGGIIFFRLGFHMLESVVSRTKSTPKEEAEALTRTDIALSPLAIPLIAGPGAITSSMILAGQAETLPTQTALYVAIILTLLVTYLILRGADTFLKKLGTTGTRVIQRIMGLLLMVIAVQFIIDGVTPVMKTILQAAR